MGIICKNLYKKGRGSKDDVRLPITRPVSIPPPTEESRSRRQLRWPSGSERPI